MGQPAARGFPNIFICWNEHACAAKVDRVWKHRLMRLFRAGLRDRIQGRLGLVLRPHLLNQAVAFVLPAIANGGDFTWPSDTVPM